MLGFVIAAYSTVFLLIVMWTVMMIRSYHQFKAIDIKTKCRFCTQNRPPV